MSASMKPGHLGRLIKTAIVQKGPLTTNELVAELPSSQVQSKAWLKNKVLKHMKAKREVMQKLQPTEENVSSIELKHNRSTQKGVFKWVIYADKKFIPKTPSPPAETAAKQTA
ncbi:hypothetical protein SARC_10385 [Sphaeroforma arctica JP610]|uniref:Uncharacterized protein n=1 Tax=Sphaeroforma arctica JP610 TaxID=667725 RepID=A0A0L0FK51_9EUKA|nr:hypothetical protein SARC_10385 [Sphaeroforma arctica JP610]KNC77149.1 hypothetical protein SARC_10385 [Sphaeroforma arctica JP610]|eukprot:XP_014151051.1 hypothetical protein SARC_10385 [Sphaeroforma arctica JP610]